MRAPRLNGFVSQKQFETMKEFCRRFRITNTINGDSYNKSEYLRLVLCYMLSKEGIVYGLHFRQEELVYLKKAYEKVEKWEDVKTEQFEELCVRTDNEFKQQVEQLRQKMGVRYMISIVRTFTDAMQKVFDEQKL